MKYFTLQLITSLLITISTSCQTNSQTTRGEKLDAISFNEKFKSTEGATLLDVRTPNEFAEGKIEGAMNINFKDENFNNNISKLDKTKAYFVYCLSGGRSGAAADYMRSNGFITVYDMKGGIMAWKEAGLPVSTAASAITSDKISMIEFEKMTTDSITVLVDFYAPWCTPCAKMKPLLEEIQKENKSKVKIVRINVDENKGLSNELKVSELPVIMIYKNGKSILRHDGFADKPTLLKMIK